MSYGYYRLGSGVEGRHLPEIGPTHGVIEHTATYPSVAATIIRDTEGQHNQYRAMGYTGDVCTNPDCQSMQVKRNGTCLVCEACGQTTGCS